MPLPPTGETRGIYIPESRLCSKLGAIYMTDRTSHLALRTLKRLLQSQLTGGATEEAIDGANKTIDNFTNIALDLAGYWCPKGEIVVEQ